MGVLDPFFFKVFLVVLLSIALAGLVAWIEYMRRSRVPESRFVDWEPVSENFYRDERWESRP